jgi:hypothetical protein
MNVLPAIGSPVPVTCSSVPAASVTTWLVSVSTDFVE